MEWFVLEETLKAHLISTHCHRQGDLPLEQVEIWAQAHTHPMGCTMMPTVLVPSALSRLKTQTTEPEE